VQRDGQNYYRVSRFLIGTKFVCVVVVSKNVKPKKPSFPTQNFKSHQSWVKFEKKAKKNWIDNDYKVGNL
jgi:hypothetical protein